ncbi:hypothetical protein [Pimelobacter sp. 30-1]|uniref:hypothetical protein n=1 Tax=Pimelobacter sp. 30-1 TaxID=2004991 RepID=UPI001C058C8B|nr:hypothetical protein [Pimelobacter sp. 30-1]MBU2695584.1 hypothetical protein [Pimelobacter sp. 30-1]
MSHLARRWRHRTPRAVLLVVLAVALTGLAGPVEAAAPVTVAVTPVVDEGRAVTVTVRCSARSACSGTTALSLAGVGSERLRWKVAAKKSRTLRWVLTPAQYRTFAARTSGARLTATVRTTRPGTVTVTKRVTLRKAAAPVQVSLPTTVDANRRVGVSVACVARTTCSGSAVLTLAGVGTTRLAVDVAAQRTTSYTWTLTPAQHAALEAAEGGLTLTARVTTLRPHRVTVTRSGTLRTPSAQVSTDLERAEIGADHLLTVPLTCASATGCAGTLTLLASGTPKITAGYTLSRGPGSVTFEVPHAVAMNLTTAWDTGFALLVSESAPHPFRTTRPLALRLSERALSVAYAQRNWVPNSQGGDYDTCPATLHASYETVGPDGKVYPTWHPARVVDPATGQLCTFGHEHGADPTTSDIYGWVADWYAPADLRPSEPRGLPFGYVSEQLDHWIMHGGEGHSMRHEDNAGHKVFVANNVKMIDADKNWLYLPGTTTKVECDYLIKAHQGSWSADATANNAHELLFAVKCNDGTAMITSTLGKFGNSNELNPNCDPTQTVATVGSTLPPGQGGRRLIPTAACIEAWATGSNAQEWALYEVWEGHNTITTSDGAQLASFDPWFGVRDPSRYYDPAKSTATANGISRPIDLAWRTTSPATTFPWSEAITAGAHDWVSPDSPFNGAKRDFYLNQLQLTDPGTPGDVVFTTPYGDQASATRFEGSIPQYVHPGGVLGTVRLATQKFDTNADWGKNNGVHAPN